MIGVFSYTVILTYISLISAISGIMFGFNGNALVATICLLICGLCDMFDGKIASTKKRNEFEIKFGIEIDSLTDLVAFGVLPIVIGGSLNMSDWYYIPIYAIYVLSVLIHLSNYNVNNKIIGAPVTVVTLIIPLLYLLRHMSYLNIIYALVLLILSVLYMLKFNFKRLNKKYSITLLVIGVI